ncbi:MAG: ABC transporter ATP-binding protein/permease [Cyanobacteria bacterium J06626_14]
MTSCIEALGIGVIGPFIALASDFSLIEQMPLLARVREVLNIEQENHFVAVIGLLVVSLFLIKTLSAWATQVFIARFSDEQQRLLIIKMTRGYLEAPYVYHITKNSSSITDRLIEIANSFSGAMFMPLLTTAANIFLFIALFTLLCFTSLPIMIGLLATLLPILIYFNSFARKVGAWGKQMRESKAGIIQTVNHAFGSVKETKNIGCEAYFEDQIAYQAKKLEKAHRTFIAFKILPRFVLESVIVISVIVTISISIFLNGEGVAGTTSVLGVFALASVRLLPAITNFINGVNQLRASSYTVNQIYHELRELSAFQDEQSVAGDRSTLNGSSQHRPVKLADSLSLSPSPNEGLAHHLQFRQQVSLKGVTYRYPSSSHPVISDLSLSIKKGESIAFIGKSGAGKTTLVDIILGLLIPQSGDIEVDGVSVYPDLRAWKNLIAYIPQTIFLIDDSIEKNIAFGVPDHLVDREKIARAIHVAQLTDVIAGLPNGVETLVGERGVLLSGGQRQRVGIARAIYHDREILVLDEATAALDNETEKLVTDSIASLSSSDQITLITIAHRLSTIKGCDRIYTLGNGQIVKSGTYAEVVEGVHFAGESRKSLANAD